MVETTPDSRAICAKTKQIRMPAEREGLDLVGHLVEVDPGERADDRRAGQHEQRGLHDGGQRDAAELDELELLDVQLRGQLVPEVLDRVVEIIGAATHRGRHRRLLHVGQHRGHPVVAERGAGGLDRRVAPAA